MQFFFSLSLLYFIEQPLTYKTKPHIRDSPAFQISLSRGKLFTHWSALLRPPKYIFVFIRVYSCTHTSERLRLLDWTPIIIRVTLFTHYSVFLNSLNFIVALTWVKSCTLYREMFHRPMWVPALQWVYSYTPSSEIALLYSLEQNGLFFRTKKHTHSSARRLSPGLKQAGPPIPMLNLTLTNGNWTQLLLNHVPSRLLKPNTTSGIVKP